MRNFATAAAVLLLAAASMATAIPAQAQENASAPFAWTGVYAGAFVGGAYHRTYWDELDNDWWNGSEKATSGGFYGGGYAGFNWQSDAFLFGVETDFGFATNSRKDNLSNGVWDDVERNELNWLATVRGRAGIVQNDMLIFVTGGLAVADFDTFMTSDNFPSDVYKASGVRVGWVAGAGVEIPLTDSLSLEIEGLYHDFGSKTYKQVGDSDEDEIGNIVITGRVGIAFHF